jgi:HK97 gp10 family phage protein
MSNFTFIENNRGEVEMHLESTLAKALTEIGLQAESDVADVTPVDTGNLRGSIVSEPHASDTSVIIGSNVEYAPYQELGTSKMKPANGGKGFLRFALNNNLNKYMRMLEEHLNNG